MVVSFFVYAETKLNGRYMESSRVIVVMAVINRCYRSVT